VLGSGGCVGKWCTVCVLLEGRLAQPTENCSILGVTAYLLPTSSTGFFAVHSISAVLMPPDTYFNLAQALRANQQLATLVRRRSVVALFWCALLSASPLDLQPHVLNVTNAPPPHQQSTFMSAYQKSFTNSSTWMTVSGAASSCQHWA